MIRSRPRKHLPWEIAGLLSRALHVFPLISDEFQNGFISSVAIETRTCVLILDFITTIFTPHTSRNSPSPTYSKYLYVNPTPRDPLSPGDLKDTSKELGGGIFRLSMYVFSFVSGVSAIFIQPSSTFCHLHTFSKFCVGISHTQSVCELEVHLEMVYLLQLLSNEEIPLLLGHR